MDATCKLSRSPCFAAVVLLSAAPLLFARQVPGGAKPPPAAGESKLSQQELDQMLAPLALYPDSLLSQIFMASTYPLEVVEADRWVKRYPMLTGNALTDALEKLHWDPSVKSLVNFPQVLAMMSEKLEWTTKLGDAFLSQPEDVLATIQQLRAKAKAEGNLQSTSEQVVTVEPAPEDSAQAYITIEQADPQVIYVPTYDPAVVYGAWWYPDYPPDYYYPPGYVATAAVAFGAGLLCGAAWGYAWGDLDWHHGDIDIDFDRNTFVNNRIDRSRYRNTSVDGRWRHDPTHRKGVGYRDRQVAQQFNRPSAADAARAREAYRGYAEGGRQDLARGGADQFKGDRAALDRTDRPADRPRADQMRGRAATAADRGRLPDRPGAPAGAQRRDATGGQFQRPGGNAFGDGQSGNAARQQSQRGQASRSAASRPAGGVSPVRKISWFSESVPGGSRPGYSSTEKSHHDPIIVPRIVQTRVHCNGCGPYRDSAGALSTGMCTAADPVRNPRSDSWHGHTGPTRIAPTSPGRARAAGL